MVSFLGLLAIFTSFNHLLADVPPYPPHPPTGVPSMAKPMPLPTSRIPGFSVALPMARHHRGPGVEGKLRNPRQGGSALWLLLLVCGKKNHIRITQIYQYIECVFQCSCFDYHSFITPVRSQVVLFGAGKMLRGLFECDLVRYVLLKQLANVCPSVLKGRCWVQHAFVPDFRLLSHEYAKKCVKYIVKSRETSQIYLGRPCLQVNHAFGIHTPLKSNILDLKNNCWTLTSLPKSKQKARFWPL